MRIAIVNDMPMAVEALRRALAFEPAHEVIWVARDGAEAVLLCAEKRAHILWGEVMWKRNSAPDAGT